MKRSEADLILTYFAKDVALMLKYFTFLVDIYHQLTNNENSLELLQNSG